MSKQGKKIKKVLIVIASYSAFRNPLNKAFKSLGIRTYYFDNRKTTVFEKLFFGLAMIYSPLYAFATKHINYRLLKTVEFMKPDLVLVSKGENLSATTIRNISQKTIIVNWFTVLFLQVFKGIEDWLSVYSVFFTGDRADVRTYQAKGHKNLYCLPYAGPTLGFSTNKKKYDVVFIGVFNKERERIFQKLTRFNLKIWGNKKWEKSKLRKNYMGKWLNSKEVTHVLKNSKIVVNNHQNRVLNLRVYEATSAGALLITDYSDDLPLMYKIGREVIVYKNKNDLFNKVKYYLENNAQRERIAKAGYKKQNKNHTYEKRIKEMIKIIN